MIRGIIIAVKNGAVRLFSADARSAGEFEDREFFQHYGFASRPKQGAEVIIIREGNHFVSIADGDRRYNIELEDGEVAIHDDLGQRVHLTRDGIVAESPKRITADAPEINLGGDRAGLLALIDERIITLINNHVHPNVQPGSGTSGKPLVQITAEMVCTEATRAK